MLFFLYWWFGYRSWCSFWYLSGIESGEVGEHTSFLADVCEFSNRWIGKIFEDPLEGAVNGIWMGRKERLWCLTGAELWKRILDFEAQLIWLPEVARIGTVALLKEKIFKHWEGTIESLGLFNLGVSLNFSKFVIKCFWKTILPLKSRYELGKKHCTSLISTEPVKLNKLIMKVLIMYHCYSL